MTDDIAMWWTGLGPTVRDSWIDCYAGSSTLIPDLIPTLPPERQPHWKPKPDEWIWWSAAAWNGGAFTIQYHLADELKTFLDAKGQARADERAADS